MARLGIQGNVEDPYAKVNASEAANDETRLFLARGAPYTFKGCSPRVMSLALPTAPTKRDLDPWRVKMNIFTPVDGRTVPFYMAAVRREPSERSRPRPFTARPSPRRAESGRGLPVSVPLYRPPYPQL